MVGKGQPPPIDTLHILNFKSLEDVSLRFGRITVLVGPNGSGKSSILQPLAILKQSLDQNVLTFSGDLLDLGDFSDVIFRHDKSRALEFTLSGTRHFEESLRPVAGYDVDYSYNVAFDNAGLLRNFAKFSLGVEDISVEWKRGVREEKPQREMVFRPYTFYFRGGARIARAVEVGSANDPTPNIPGYNEVAEQVDRLLSTVVDILKQTYFIPAGRGVDKRAYPLGEKSAIDFVSAAGVTAQAEQFAGALAYTRGLEAKVTQLMQRITSVRVGISMQAGRKVAVVTESGQGKDELIINIVNEGSGTNQLVILLTQLVASPEGSLIAIEEPEIHLHPRAQAMLAEVLVDFAIREDKYLIIATHSEHVLFGLLTAVAQGKLQSDELGVYYMKRTNLSAVAEKVHVDANGRIEGGLGGFFEADVQEFEKYLSALIKKPRR